MYLFTLVKLFILFLLLCMLFVFLLPLMLVNKDYQCEVVMRVATALLRNKN